MLKKICLLFLILIIIASCNVFESNDENINNDETGIPDPYTGILVDPDTGLPSTNDNAITDYEYALLHN